MSRKDVKIRAKVSGGTAQGVIGAGEVLVEHLVINNYAQPSPVPDEMARAETSALPENPYKGLLHFGPDDHALFFGRDKAIDKLVKAVDEHSFNAVLGPSGCGKSSLLLAGVAPRLDATGQWVFTYFRISDSVENDPFLALTQALLPLYQPDLDETDRLLQRRKLSVALREGEIPLTDVFDAIHRNWPQRKVLLIADQFEELYTSDIDFGIQARFMDFLIEATRVSAAGTTPAFSLAVTLRADFLGLASQHRPFADAIDESVHILGPMKPDELRQAIVEPAGQRDVAFEEGLVETILADVGREPGNLPLLEFALTQMWGRQEDHYLTLASYSGVGRVTGALTKHADEVFGSLDSASQRQARHIFTQLVKPGPDTEDTRRVARRDELDAIWPLVQRLAGPENRLVVTNNTADKGETAEVVHEALIKHWGTLRNWVAQDRELLTWLDALRSFLKTWTDHDFQEEDLLRGAALSQAEEWSAKRRDALNDNEKAFIDASMEYRDRLKKEEKTFIDTNIEDRDQVKNEGRDRQRPLIKLVSLVVVLALLIGTGVGYKPYIEFRAEQALYDKIWLIEAGDKALMIETIWSLDQLDPEHQKIISASLRREIITFYRDRIRAVFRPQEGLYDYPQAQDLLSQAKKHYPESVSLSTIEDQIKEQHDRLMNSLISLYKRYYDAKKLVKTDSGEDLTTVIPIIKRVDPNHYLLKDKALSDLYLSEAETLISKQKYKDASNYIVTGLKLFPDDYRLQSLNKQINAQLQMSINSEQTTEQ
jgi:energy-coupling factor transporter ATP-binding protein EcfA2